MIQSYVYHPDCVISVYKVLYRFYMPACPCARVVCWVCLDWVQTRSFFLVSVFVPRASLAHDHLTWICVAKAMPCFRVQLNAQLHPLTLGHVLVAMVTASGVTVNEKSALDDCTIHFSLCLCIKLGTLLHLFTQGRLTRSLQHGHKVGFTSGWFMILLLHCSYKQKFGQRWNCKCLTYGT